MPLQVEIISAEGKLYSGEADMVIAPAVQGEIGVAPQHAPLLTVMIPGELRVNETGGEVKEFFVGGGVLEVQPNAVTVLADHADRAGDLDEDAVRKAVAEAEEKLVNQNSDMEVAKAKAELLEAAARLKLVQKLRK